MNLPKPPFQADMRPHSAKRSRVGIRAHLAAITLIALIPPAAISIVAVSKVAASGQAAYEARLLEIASNLSVALDRHFDSKLTTLAAMARSPLVEDPNSPASTEWAKAVADQIGTYIAVSDSGMPPGLVFHTDYPGANTGSRFLPWSTTTVWSPRETISRAMSTRTPQVSGLYWSQLTNEYLAVASVPIVRNSDARGAIATGIQPEQLLLSLRQHLTRTDLTFVLLDGNNRVAVHSHAGTRSTGREFALPASTSSGRIQTFADLDGTDQAWATQELQLAKGWRLLVGASAQGLADSRWIPLRRLLLLGLTAIAGALGLSMWLGGRIARSVMSLTKLADDLARTREGSHPSNGLSLSGVAEFDDLGVRIHDATLALRDRTELAEASADELAASERRFRTLAEGGTNIVWRADSDGRFIPGDHWSILTGQMHTEQEGDGWIEAVDDNDHIRLVSGWAPGRYWKSDRVRSSSVPIRVTA